MKMHHQMFLLISSELKMYLSPKNEPDLQQFYFFPTITLFCFCVYMELEKSAKVCVQAEGILSWEFSKTF